MYFEVSVGSIRNVFMLFYTFLYLVGGANSVPVWISQDSWELSAWELERKLIGLEYLLLLQRTLQEWAS